MTTDDGETVEDSVQELFSLADCESEGEEEKGEDFRLVLSSAAGWRRAGPKKSAMVRPLLVGSLRLSSYFNAIR